MVLKYYVHYKNRGQKFLNKPFNQSQMREALEEILGAGEEWVTNEID
jgi:hypothetical protein